MAGVRRVAQHDQHGLVLLDLIGGVRFLAQRTQWTKLLGGALQILERICQENVQPLVTLRLVAPLPAKERFFIHRRQRQAKFEVRHGVRGHQQLEPEEAR